jgi:hypothetical protein
MTDGSVRFALDVTPDRSGAVIAVAGRRKDGLAHVGIAAAGRGTSWVMDTLVDLTRTNRGPVSYDPSSPAASLVPELESHRVEMMPLVAREIAQACGLFYDAVKDRRLRHLGAPSLTDAIDGAAKSPIGDEAWKWSRKNSGVDISPLVAVTLALWAFETTPSVIPRVISLADALAGIT